MEDVACDVNRVGLLRGNIMPIAIFMSKNLRDKCTSYREKKRELNFHSLG